jgi:Ser/Thr protein kinase RdoA (MazF antagonist)
MGVAGQTLATLHQQLRGFLPDGGHHLGFKSYVEDRHRHLAWHKVKIEELEARSSRLDDPQDRAHADWLVEKSQFIFEELQRLDELLSGAALPRLIIHGDYGFHNIIFRASGLATPVDFELARLEWRLSDLVSCLTKFRFGNGAYDFESLQRFMGAYQSVFPLSDLEWGLFPQVWRFYKLMGAVQYWSSYFETGGPARKLVSARDAIDQADWANSHPQMLLSLKAE